MIDRTVARVRLAAMCLLLTGLAFLQDPGQLYDDTKIDLVVNPVGLLQRALHLWDPTGSFGQVQNQGYGYLWPMGPFFAVGQAFGLPAWVVQRLWWALLLCVAATGLATLAKRLRIGSPGAQLVAGVAYALTPRIVSLLGERSVEAWPMALAPWVLVPLIGLADGERLRGPVIRSAVAVGLIGGVNATAALAVLPPALLWLAMLHPVRQRVMAIVAWCAAVVAATCWWVAPLVMLGWLSPPILAFTEGADTTTWPTDPVSILRGASNWLGYLGTSHGPWWPAASRVATEGSLVVATTAVAALGIVGLSRRGMPHRLYLVTCLVAGVALVSLGHVSDLWGTAGELGRAFLSGPGATLRNVHKFDLVLRLPLALGLAHALGLLLRLAARTGGRPKTTRLAAATAAAAVVSTIAIAAAPVAATGLGGRGGFEGVPDYWREASAWLNQRAGHDRVLVVPASMFASYRWGTAEDEMTQPLLDVNHAVRSAAPSTPAGTIRLLDSIESVLASGSGSAGLADVLARSGIRYVLLRSDLDYGAANAVRPLVARQALARSPGLARVAGFGPQVGGDSSGTVLVDQGLDVATQALEIFEVQRKVSAIAAYDLSDVITVAGGPEALLDLDSAGMLGAAPVVLAGDRPAGATGPGSVTLTDSLRRREVAFGALHDNASTTMTASDAYALPRNTHDYLPAWVGMDDMTTASYRGIAEIRASSAWSQAGLFGGSRPEHLPYAAVDGNASTSWRPAPTVANEGQWIHLELAEPRNVASLELLFDMTAEVMPTQVTVVAAGQATTASGFGPTMTIALPGDRLIRTIDVRIDQVLTIGGRVGTFGISEITIPGVVASRTLVLPQASTVDQPTSTSVLLTAAPTTPECFFVAEVVRCSPGVARGSEDGGTIDRTLTLAAADSYDVRLWARPTPGLLLNAALDYQTSIAATGAPTPDVTASSSAISDPGGRPGVVVDGDPQTYWVADVTDTAPLLRLTYSAPRTVTGLRITVPDGVAAKPGAVRVIGDSGQAYGFLDGDGQILFAPAITTDDLTIMLYPTPGVTSLDPYLNYVVPVAVGVGEVQVLPDDPRSPVTLDVPVNLPCGSGPEITVGGVTAQTNLVATRRDLLELREVPALVCALAPFDLPAGESRVVATGSALATPIRVSLTPAGSPPPAAQASQVRVASWLPTQREVRLDVAGTERVLVMRENTNPGWQARTADGTRLSPITLDGWQQGFIVPAGVGGEIVIEFVVDTYYRQAIFGGLGVLLVLIVVALIPNRRRGRHAVDAVRVPGPGRVLTAIVGTLSLIVVGGVIGAGLALVTLVLCLTPLRRSVLRQRARMRWRLLDHWFPVAALGAGLWWSVRLPDSHTSALIQISGLAAVASLWFFASAASAAQAENRLLQQVPAGGGAQQAEADRQRVDLEEVTSEQRLVGDRVDGLQDHEVPEEQAVGDRPEPTGWR